jgi:phosphoribosylanthranilate isomerase
MWIKICGMTSEAAVEACLRARVDAIGFVFAPSVRRLDPWCAAQLAAPARGRVTCVAVTLHPTQEFIEQLLREFEPDVLQSDLEDIERLRLPADLPVLPVLRGQALPRTLPPRILFEGPHSGTGREADWRTAAQLANATELVLAGGLRANNVAAAIGVVRPFGLDVSSGVEVAPGEKSPERIAEFVQAARAAVKGMEYERNRNRN